MEIDIHGYGKKVERNIQILKESNIMPRTKPPRKDILVPKGQGDISPRGH